MFKILIVEDDRGIAEGIQSLLEQWGMEARQVQDFRNIKIGRASCRERV